MQRPGAKTNLELKTERKTMHAATMNGNMYQRPTTTRAKMISLVPDHEPLKSPCMDYSKNVHLTSNFDDYDPQKIVKKLERNKLV